MSKYESKTKIHKDAYFRLEHLKTGHRLGFDEMMNAELAAEDEEVARPRLFKVKKDIFTFRFRIAEFLDVWEINFLTTCKKIFLDTVS
jgi:hypothetical protein